MTTSLTTAKVKAFVYGEQLWIVCLHQLHGHRDHFVRLYQLHVEKLVTKHVVELGDESNIDVRGASAHYLITCVFRMYSGSGTFYKWEACDIHAETVNGKPLAKQFLLGNGEQVIASIPSFTEPISINDIVADFVSPVQLSGVPLTEFMDKLVLKRFSTQAHHQYALQKQLGSSPLAKLWPHRGVIIEEMLNNVMLLSVPQLVDGIKVFENCLHLESLLANQVNGLSIKVHVHRVVHRNVQQVIAGKKTVIGQTERRSDTRGPGPADVETPVHSRQGHPSCPSAIQGNLRLNKVNDLYLEQLLAERVMLLTTWLSNFVDPGNFSCERINGISREHLVTQSGEHRLAGAKTSIQDIEICGNLNAFTVSGYDPVELTRGISLVFSASIEVGSQITVVGTADGIGVQNLDQNFDAGKNRRKHGGTGHD
ncbi:hypothetical protein HPB50_025848 [Hyalomma asiaticum]|uniref:Uncharacterized protein n=1 Tax=Hyalomma asiaticum TaxID=266040 RepID=A0ACB7TPF3_HYAAI|nr:hypothetical protein HPB50_025848 [Hyalomma asiaticum]